MRKPKNKFERKGLIILIILIISFNIFIYKGGKINDNKINK